jgi:hypothetical protein
MDGGWVFAIELLDELVSIDVGERFPAVMCFRESLPPDQVLELLASFPCTQDLFYFPFGLAVHKVRSGFLVLLPFMAVSL